MRRSMRLARIRSRHLSAQLPCLLGRIILGSLVGCSGFFFEASPRAWGETDSPAKNSSTSTIDDHLTASTVRYNETLGDAIATLDFYPYSLGTSIVFDVKPLDGRAPSLELQGRMLDVLLTRLLNDHPDITSLHVQLAGNREALIEPLNQFLLHSPEWDYSRGRPRHGQLGSFLTETINGNGILASLIGAFGDHDFSFKLQHVGKIDIERISTMNGARLPLHIDDMSFAALKNIKLEN